MFLQLLGNWIFNDPEDYMCVDDDTALVPATNIFASYMLVHSLTVLSFAVMVIIVFYMIPASFNLIAKGNDIKKINRAGFSTSTFDGDTSEKRHNSSMNNNNVEHFLQLHLSNEIENEMLNRKHSSPKNNRLHHLSNSNSTLRM